MTPSLEYFILSILFMPVYLSVSFPALALLPFVRARIFTMHHFAFGIFKV